MKSFYYVRHGQTDWNLENRAMGRTDIPLNATGIQQAIEARNGLIGLGITDICYSPLSRAKTTAEIFNEVLFCKMHEIEELQEFHLGPYEGKSKDSWFEEWRAGARIEGAESHAGFLSRCLRGLNKALSLPGPVLIVSHGGVYWAVERAIGLPDEGGLPNCAPVYHKPPVSSEGKWVRVPVSLH